MIRVHCLIALVVAASTLSCTHGTPGHDPSLGSTAVLTADEVISRHVGVVGEAIVDLESVRVQLEIVEPTFTVTGDYRAARDGRMRIDIFADDQRVFSEGIDRKGAWQQHGSGAAIEPVSADGEAALRRGIQYNLWGLYDLSARGHSASLIGREIIDATSYYVLRVRMNDGFERIVLIDPDTWLISRIREVSALHPDLDDEKRPAETINVEYIELCDMPWLSHDRKIDRLTGEEIQRTRMLSAECNLDEQALELDRPG